MAKIHPAQVLSVVRHAEAGDRERFVGDDSLRPLSRQGRRQANALAKRLGESSLDLITSPYLRCVETLSPTSSRLRRAMMLASWLVEGEPADEALYQLIELTGEIGGLVACTHQDVMLGMVDVALAAGAVPSSQPIFEKAATAEFTIMSGKVVAVSFVAPPKI
jgi:phosphohistidine phosphatase SixA